MKKYRVNVNGTDYEVVIELIDEAAASLQIAPEPAASHWSGEKILSPLPGTILDIKVSKGDAVTKGKVLFIMEAMKMENEIAAPRDGRIASINVSKGASVDFEDLLCVIE
ncbi:MAG: acetyl-CoA carboxylase biotin carboxyl carrier protein subunit [Syntrophomonadaceae bacterium]|nr:acetyl-CoA carboxylase biotin carboxyl carrier protein subunit [Syntrophomonadaceae bacterium]